MIRPHKNRYVENGEVDDVGLADVDVGVSGGREVTGVLEDDDGDGDSDECCDMNDDDGVGVVSITMLDDVMGGRGELSSICSRRRELSRS